ncbi:sugar ABC transporter substrate-binding protein [Yersinia pestis]|nr:MULTISPECIES: substrate-binding domain-containing protein [Yersinia pseudotuberculosis complex]EDR33427.1 ribose ABC transporter, periplasmic ribose-binding protein [Yersinia pestis biovar Orientalis str. IP275]EFA46734.1 periplasmic binding protein and sugar binding domain of the LacI family protein [Yersinia pestis KIM D27]ERP77157.1 sugar ABC transporter substrate-binding protein [Yersinia pestis 24H]CQD52763.1 sugar-binding periplasmic protein [Yersinia intermedia]ABG12378.1 sugar-bindi
MKKTMLQTLLAATLILSFAASVQAAPVKIAILMYGMKAEFVQLMEKSAKEHPAVTQGLTTLTLFDGRYDPLVQNNQAETAIRTRYDAIIIVPIDFEANVDVVTMANKANIPVIVANARLNTDKATSGIFSDDVQGGYLEAKAVLDKMQCQGNVVVIEGPIGQSAQIQRGQGNDKAIAECGPGKINVLERKTANWSRAEAMPLMENWLQKHRGKINGVIGQNDEMALGAIEAIKSAGLNVQDFAIAGIDGVSDAIRAVKQGEMMSILQDGQAQIQGAIDIAMRSVQGERYQPMSTIWQQYQGKMDWQQGTAKMYEVPWTEVTPQNADELLKMRQ